jgi:hypothetical protein
MNLELQWLFHGASGVTRREVIRWWEERRLSYNAYVGVVGFAAWLLVLIAGSAAVKPGVDFEEPIAMISGPFFCAIFANICYTFGWIVDIAAFCGSPRRALFRAGFIFSIVLTALLGAWAVTAYLITVYTAEN